jgi:hypothetical protein
VAYYIFSSILVWIFILNESLQSFTSLGDPYWHKIWIWDVGQLEPAHIAVCGLSCLLREDLVVSDVGENGAMGVTVLLVDRVRKEESV